MSPAKIQWFQELVGNIGLEKVMTHQLIIIPELVKLYVLCQHQQEEHLSLSAKSVHIPKRKEANQCSCSGY